MKKNLTANYLPSGNVVYLDSEKKWTENSVNADVFDNQEDADNALTFVEAQIDKQKIRLAQTGHLFDNPNLIDVEEDGA
jgi:hypothetical protein